MDQNQVYIRLSAWSSVTDDLASVLRASDKMPPPLVGGYGDAPSEFVCPIELRLMEDDPVLASDGYTYSRTGLEAWISQCESNGLPLFIEIKQSNSIIPLALY